LTYMTHNLVKRCHSWSVRYVIPRKYREAFGKNEVVRALNTRDLDEARKLRHGALSKIIKEVEQTIYPNLGTPKEAIDQAVSMAQDISEAEDPDLIQGVIMEMIKDKEAELGKETTKQMWAVAINNEVPVSLAAEQFTDFKEGKVTKGAVDGYRKVARQFVNDMGDLPMTSITPKVASKWLTDFLEPSGRLSGTLGRYIAGMNLLWKWSYRREWCFGQSPFDGFTSELSKSKRSKRSFTDSELCQFLDALNLKANKHPEERDVAILLIESGARLNEIAELKVSHVFADGEVHIHDGKTKSSNRCLFFHSRRAQEILDKRVAGKGPDDQLFHELKPGGQDQKLGHSLSKRMRRTLAEAIPNAKEQGLDLHSIRRWAGTVFDNMDADRILIKRAFGHTTGDLLGDVYSAGPEKKRLSALFSIFNNEIERRIP
jgi:integrase